jgi:hypothetical protein
VTTARSKADEDVEPELRLQLGIPGANQKVRELTETVKPAFDNFLAVDV